MSANAQDNGADPLSGIRAKDSIGRTDHRAIHDWIRDQVDVFAKSEEPDRFKRFRTRFREQLRDPGNSEQFVRALAEQAGVVATEDFAKADTDPTVAHGLARILLDIKRSDRLPGLIAGLVSKEAVVRFLCARGLAEEIPTLENDKDRRLSVITALRSAGAAESEYAVLSRIYLALAYDKQVQEVFDGFMVLFDARLQLRRKAVFVDRAEVDAYSFFLRVAGQLAAPQKAELVKRIAVFLRLDAERYAARWAGKVLSVDEQQSLESRLGAAEELLGVIVGNGRGGDITGTLAYSFSKADGVVQDPEKKDAMLRALALWVGAANADGTPKSGILNDAPWSLPIGAP